jgi:thiol:disulfide interchange protein DsbC
MKKLLFLLTVVLLAAPDALFAGDPLAEVKQLPVVKSIFPPQIQILEARDMGSIYEIVTGEPSGKQLYYLTKDGAYMIVGGNLIDKNKTNLTQKRLDEVTRIDLSKLPLNDAVVIKKGNGAKKLIMFTDLDCPYCKRGYDWVKVQNNYTLYVFFFPLPMHPASPEKSISVLCSKNPETTFDRAQSGENIESQKCDAGEKMLAKHKEIGNETQIDGTPLFVTDTGIRIKGADTNSLEKYFKN